MPQTVYQELIELAQQAGTSLSQICEDENIDRTVIQKWKKGDPKSIRTYKQLVTAIEKVKNSK